MYDAGNTFGGSPSSGCLVTLAATVRRAAVVALGVVAALGIGPAEARAQETACGERAELRITVLDESGAVALPGVEVVVQWTGTGRRPTEGSTGEDGRYTLCAPSNAEGAVVWAQAGADGSRRTTIELEPGGAREVELRVVFAMSSPGRVLGRVYDALTGDPVATAAVSVVGRAAAVESNRQGNFVLSEVPRGEREIEIRRLGYATLRQPITIRPGITTEMEVGLVPTPVEMEPLVAIAERSLRLEIKGFYERRHWGELLGLGDFFDEDYIERWRPVGMRQFIQDHTFLGSGLVNRRSGCVPTIYVDGMSVTPRELNHVVLPIEVGGVEVYRGPASLPAEFGGPGSRCGVVAIWIK